MLFDIDGVLAHTAPHHADARRETAREFGIKQSSLSDDEIRGPIALASQAGMTVVGLGRLTQMRSAHLVHDSLRGIKALLLLQWLQSIETPAA